MDSDTIQVIRLERRLAGRAAEVMLCAYKRDPMMEYVLPDAERKTRRTMWFIETGLRYGRRYGDVYTTPDVSGVAVWLPPDHPEMTLTGLLRTGLLFAPFRLGRKPFRRLLNCVEYTHHVHHELLPGPHWYLYELAVEPSRQSMGIGAALMKPVLDRADETGLSCYLETFAERAVSFYDRLGFTVEREGAPPKGGPICWSMVRKPSREANSPL